MIRNGLGKSELIQLTNVAGMKTEDMQKLTTGKHKFKVRIGVRLNMPAYGWVRDVGRKPTSPGKSVPYEAIADWCRRYGLRPRGQSFHFMVKNIMKKINEEGYEGNNYLHDAIAAFATSGIVDYTFWQPQGDKIERKVNKAAKTTVSKYRGWRRMIGDYTLTTS